MIICKVCGVDNDLGHVFCTGCGAKLDLSNMSSSTVGTMQQESWLRRFRGWIILGVLVLLTIPVVLAMWPQTELLGEAGRPVGRMRVRDGLSTLQRHAANPQIRGFELAFAERDINGYFAYSKTGEMELESVSVRIGDGAFRIRVVRKLAEVNLGFVKWVPQVSTDMLLVPIGSVLRPRQVTVGRLRLIGPLRRPAIRGVWNRFAAQREWEILSSAASEIRAENGQLVVAVARP